MKRPPPPLPSQDDEKTLMVGPARKAHGPGGTAAPAGPDVSLAILPFRNASADPSLDWLGASLADMLSTDVGQSAHLRTILPGRLHQVLADLRISPSTNIDPATLQPHAAPEGYDYLAVIMPMRI